MLQPNRFDITEYLDQPADVLTAAAVPQTTFDVLRHLEWQSDVGAATDAAEYAEMLYEWNNWLAEPLDESSTRKALGEYTHVLDSALKLLARASCLTHNPEVTSVLSDMGEVVLHARSGKRSAHEAPWRVDDTRRAAMGAIITTGFRRLER